MVKRRMVLLALVGCLLAAAVYAQDFQVIGDIRVEGNTKTDPRVITTEMWLKRGDVYSEAAVTEARQRVMNLRYFQTVQIETVPGDAAGVVDLVVKVKERITWGLIPIISIDGDDSDDNEYGFSIEENNLFGEGKSVGLSGSTTEEVRSYSAWYSDPQFFYTHWTAGVSGSMTLIDTRDYDDDITMWSVSGGYRPTYQTSIAASLSLREDQYDKVNAAIYTGANALPDDANTTYLTLGASYSDVDYKIDSLEGYGGSIIYQMGLEDVAGGDYDFSKIILSGTYYRTVIRSDWIKLKASYGAGTDTDDVPLSHELFGVGGGSSIRGYSPSYRVGDRYAVITAQYEVPFWYPRMFGFSGTAAWVVFVDTGDAWLEDDDDMDWITGAGAGLRGYVNELQAFTFGLDFGYGFEEEEFQPHLTFGGSF